MSSSDTDPLFRREFPPLDLPAIVRYAGAAGDLNPMHYDRDLATSQGFPANFAHGMLVAGLVGTALAEAVGLHRVRSFGSRFVAPVYVDAHVVVTGRERDRSGDRIVLDLQAEVDDRLVVQAWAEVIAEGTAET